MVVGGCSWLAVVVVCVIDQFVWCFLAVIFFFIVVDILFYCVIYIIFILLKAKIKPPMLGVLQSKKVK